MGLTHRISGSGTRRPPNPKGMTPVSTKWPFWGPESLALSNGILELEALLERSPLHRHGGPERRGLSGGLGVGQSCPQNVGMDAGPGGTQAFALGCSGVSLGDRQHLGAWEPLMIFQRLLPCLFRITVTQWGGQHRDIRPSCRR